MGSKKRSRYVDVGDDTDDDETETDDTSDSDGFICDDDDESDDDDDDDESRTDSDVEWGLSVVQAMDAFRWASRSE